MSGVSLTLQRHYKGTGPLSESFLAIGLGQSSHGNIRLDLSDRIRELRSSMRERMLQSPLCDQPAFARNFDEVIRGVWQERCGKP